MLLGLVYHSSNAELMPRNEYFCQKTAFTFLLELMNLRLVVRSESIVRSPDRKCLTYYKVPLRRLGLLFGKLVSEMLQIVALQGFEGLHQHLFVVGLGCEFLIEALGLTDELVFVEGLPDFTHKFHLIMQSIG